MNYIKRLLIVPCLTPLMIVLIIAVTNLKPKTSLNLFIWQTPKLHLSIWMVMGTTLGVVAGSSVGIDLRHEGLKLKRQVHVNQSEYDYKEKQTEWESDYEEDSTDQDFKMNSITNEAPQRELRDPPPTVSIPYRILTKDNQYYSSNKFKDRRVKRGKSASRVKPKESKYEDNNPMRSQADIDGWESRNMDEW